MSQPDPPRAPSGETHTSGGTVPAALTIPQLHHALYPRRSLDRISSEVLEVMRSAYLECKPCTRVEGKRVFYVVSATAAAKLSRRAQLIRAGVPLGLAQVGTSGNGKTFATRFISGRERETSTGRLEE